MRVCFLGGVCQGTGDVDWTELLFKEFGLKFPTTRELSGLALKTLDSEIDPIAAPDDSLLESPSFSSGLSVHLAMPGLSPAQALSLLGGQGEGKASPVLFAQLSQRLGEADGGAHALRRAPQSKYC